MDERDAALVGLESLLAAPLGVALLDRDLRFCRINDTLAGMHGRSVDDHIGRSIHEVIPEVSPTLDPLLRRILERGQPLHDIELVHGPRAFVGNYFPVRTVDGDIVGVGGMVVEVTRHREVEHELRRAVRTREDLLAIVSHDLRAPLATIDLTTTMLEMQLGADPRVRNHLAMIHRSAARMRHMIDDLIDSASITEGRLALQLVPESAHSLMTEALDLQEALAIERGIRIQRAIDVGDSLVICDRLRILQVFGNLIGNSIKFCRIGGAIEVAGRRRDREVEFSVRDDGPGISPDVMPSLFDPYRLPPSQPQAGSGLGLHISKGIIERHGGRIWVDTEVGRGTTMSFTLPIAASETNGS